MKHSTYSLPFGFEQCNLGAYFTKNSTKKKDAQKSIKNMRYVPMKVETKAESINVENAKITKMGYADSGYAVD